MHIHERDTQYFCKTRLGAGAAQVFYPDSEGRNGLSEGWLIPFTAVNTATGDPVSGVVMMVAHPGSSDTLWCKGTIFCGSVGVQKYHRREGDHRLFWVTAIDEVISSIEGFAQPKDRVKTLILYEGTGTWSLRTNGVFLVGTRLLFNNEEADTLAWSPETKELLVD